MLQTILQSRERKQWLLKKKLLIPRILQKLKLQNQNPLHQQRKNKLNLKTVTGFLFLHFLTCNSLWSLPQGYLIFIIPPACDRQAFDAESSPSTFRQAQGLGCMVNSES